MKKYAGYSPIKTGTGRPVYVRDESFSVFSRVLREHRGNYNFTTVLRTVMTLNADGHRGKNLNPAGDIKSIKSGNVLMRYNLHDGNIFIQTLAFSKQNEQYPMGLYNVTCFERTNEWRPSDKPVSSQNNTQQWGNGEGKANYAAISGNFKDIKLASQAMPAHLTGAYQKANILTKFDKGDQYSMFWCEKGNHKSDDAAQALASVMQQSTNNDLPVNWLVHGEGVHTFKNAARILKAAPSVTTLAKDAKATTANNQNVYFSNPASSTSETQFKKMCEEAGLTYLGTNTNNRDLFRWSTFKNVGCEMGKEFSKMAMAGTGVGATGSALAETTVGASGFGGAITGMLNGLSKGDYLAIGAGAVLVGFAAVGAVKKSKTLAATAKCTFGRGNEKWYTDDKAILS